MQNRSNKRDKRKTYQEGKNAKLTIGYEVIQERPDDMIHFTATHRTLMTRQMVPVRQVGRGRGRRPFIRRLAHPT